jgi:hypothetical protein|tara:strand:- start:37354 stop:37692 length:339 start_codon:yes stop_codon:yes gene_type:complete
MATSGKNPKKRNTLAGTKKGTSKSATYFQNNPEAKAKKDKYNTEYHKSPERKKYRANLNKANRDSGTYGNKDGKDMSHDTKGKTSKESQSTNRARNGKGNKSSKRLSSKSKK